MPYQLVRCGREISSVPQYAMMVLMDLSARPAITEDWTQIVQLNNSELLNVGPLRLDQGEWFLSHAAVTVIDGAGDARSAEHPAVGLAAMIVLMVEDCGYHSPNYAWFSARFDRFAYVDRIVVRDDQAGQGLGRLLYDGAATWARQAGQPVLTAEVSVEPPNERSLEFHRRYGFVEIGRQVDPRYGQTVAMLSFPLR